VRQQLEEYAKAPEVKTKQLGKTEAEVFQRLIHDVDRRCETRQSTELFKQIEEEQEARHSVSKAMTRQATQQMVVRLNGKANSGEAELRQHRLQAARLDKEQRQLEETTRLANLRHPQRALDPRVQERLTQEQKIIAESYGLPSRSKSTLRRQPTPEEVRPKKQFTVQESMMSGERLMHARTYRRSAVQQRVECLELSETATVGDFTIQVSEFEYSSPQVMPSLRTSDFKRQPIQLRRPGEFKEHTEFEEVRDHKDFPETKEVTHFSNTMSSKDFRHPKERGVEDFRDPKDRDVRDIRDTKDRDVRDIRDAKDRDVRNIMDPKDRDTKDIDDRDVCNAKYRAVKNIRDAKHHKGSRDLRNTKPTMASKDLRASKDLPDFKHPNESKYLFELKEFQALESQCESPQKLTSRTPERRLDLTPEAKSYISTPIQSSSPMRSTLHPSHLQAAREALNLPREKVPRGTAKTRSESLPVCVVTLAPVTLAPLPYSQESQYLMQNPLKACMEQLDYSLGSLCRSLLIESSEESIENT
jgi:hypothetical protein